MRGPNTSSRPGASPLLHRASFWLGSLCVFVGAALHLPSFFGSSSMHYQMVGMAYDPEMTAGMVLIVFGLVIAGFGLFGRPPEMGSAQSVARTSSALVIGVVAYAMVIDVMKPATLGFVIPGMRHEYGLTAAQISIFPLSALTGTTVGSFFWGRMGDRLGRRPTIIFTALLFMATAVCGTMPYFAENVAMCFAMGAAAGGFLPLAYSLIGEIVGPERRGPMLVLLGGLGAAAGYLAASTSATILEPRFGWRALWLVGLPTAGVLIALSRFIPETPLYLRHLADKRVATPESSAIGSGQHGGRFIDIFRPPHLGIGASIGLLGLAWGLVNFGFLTWLPTILRGLGLDVSTSNTLLARSALVALPGAALAAGLYGWWKTRMSIALFALVASACLVVFAVLNHSLASQPWLLVALVSILLMTLAGIGAMLLTYSAEVYPTALRSTGAGLGAGATKAGGIVGPPLVGLLLALDRSGGAAALVVAAPVTLAAGLLWRIGIETRGRTLESIAESRRPEPARRSDAAADLLP